MHLSRRGSHAIAAAVACTMSTMSTVSGAFGAASVTIVAFAVSFSDSVTAFNLLSTAFQNANSRGYTATGSSGTFTYTYVGIINSVGVVQFSGQLPALTGATGFELVNSSGSLTIDGEAGTDATNNGQTLTAATAGFPVVVINGGSFTVQHPIVFTGGNGGNDTVAAGGNASGGAGVAVQSGTFTNQGTVIGGTGGQSSISPGTGGAGITGTAAAAQIFNSGLIAGGTGGQGLLSGGQGGAGVSFSTGGSLTNSGTINGGTGGVPNIGVQVGSNGIPVSIVGGVGTFTNQNHGVINGNVALDNYANSVTLQIGSKINGNLTVGTSSSATLTLSDDGTGGSQNYSQTVSGTTQFSGSLVKSGSGTWVLDQNMTYTGGTTITAGTLVVIGSIASPKITVDGSSQFASMRLTNVTSVSSSTVLSVNPANASTIVLDYNGNLTVTALQINGIFAAPGIYSASKEPSADPTLFNSDSGYTGTLTVFTPEPSVAGVMLTMTGLMARRRKRINDLL